MSDDLPRHDDLENPPEYTLLRDDYWKLWDNSAALRAEVEKFRVGATVIAAARNRRLDESKQRDCKWLIELLMTNTEYERFRRAFE
jgi:hypothetical protein